ncbi:MAG: hypothetical protein U5K81_13615 [Trueperaceae bacterium]|nr:hypothetical protein [Trueperaceae bacterium]
MPTMTVTYIRDFLDPEGRLPEDIPGPARTLARFQGAIVEWVTIWELYAPNPTNVACRRKPGHRPCPGTIIASPDEDGNAILWICPECEDQGRISGWQGTLWDRRDEAFREGSDEVHVTGP